MLIIEIYKKQLRHLFKYPHISGRGKKKNIIEYRRWVSLLQRKKPKFVEMDIIYMSYIYSPFIIFFAYIAIALVQYVTSHFSKYSLMVSAHQFAIDNLTQGSVSLLFSILAFLMAFITLPTISAIGYKDKLSELRENPTSGVGEDEYFLQNFHTSRALIQLAAGICSLSIVAIMAIFLIVVNGIFLGGIVSIWEQIFQVACFYIICIFALHSFLSTTSATLELINERI